MSTAIVLFMLEAWTYIAAVKETIVLLVAGTRWTTEAEFDDLTAYFQAPTEDERFNEYARRGIWLSLRPVTGLIDGHSVAAYDSH